jgi:hypothetical protein
MRRIAGLTFGIATRVLFAVTVWHLFWFLKGSTTPTDAYGSMRVDALLALQFTVPHSLLLLPAVRNRLRRVIPSAFYGCYYCVVTCLTLLLMIASWQPCSTIIWQASGIGQTALTIGFFASWIAILYSLSLTGLGYQTGWTPWWHWLRGTPLPQRRFEPTGAYRLLRHPVYLSFIGLIWFTPRRRIDRATRPTDDQHFARTEIAAKPLVLLPRPKRGGNPL